MANPEMAVAVGKKQFIGNAEIEAVQKPTEAPPRRTISGTAKAEGAHITVAHNLGIETRWATVVPNRRAGYNGAMVPDKMHPTIAMAHAGHGDGHDRAVVMAMGANPDSHASAADAILQKDSETHLDVSAALDSEKTMTRGRINSVIEESRKRQEERRIPKATLFVKGEDGTRTRIDDVRVESGVVALPDNVIDLTPKLEQKKSADGEAATSDSEAQPEAANNVYDITTGRRRSERTLPNTETVSSAEIAVQRVAQQEAAELAVVREKLAQLQTLEEQQTAA